MNISIPCMLLSLGGKCLLNWALVFLQRCHICRSFMGVFSVSLAVVDIALTVAVTTIHFPADGFFILLGLQLSRYNICLLVQMLGQVYSALQWPVVVVAGLDHFCIISQRFQLATFRSQWFFWSLVTILLWYLAVLYVFRLSDFTPVLEDVPHYQIHQCWVFHTPQILQDAMVLLFLTQGCAALHAGCPPSIPLIHQSRTLSRRSVVHKTLSIFLNTWALFLAFMAVFLLLPLVIPAYLTLNVAWLCFINSLLIGVVLCVVCPASKLAQGLAAVPPDSFCEWRFKFSPAAEDRA